MPYYLITLRTDRLPCLHRASLQAGYLTAALMLLLSVGAFGFGKWGGADCGLGSRRGHLLVVRGALTTASLTMLWAKNRLVYVDVIASPPPRAYFFRDRSSEEEIEAFLAHLHERVMATRRGRVGSDEASSLRAELEELRYAFEDGLMSEEEYAQARTVALTRYRDGGVSLN